MMYSRVCAYLLVVFVVNSMVFIGSHAYCDQGMWFHVLTNL